MAWNNKEYTYSYKAFTEGEFSYITAWGSTPFNNDFNFENMSYYHAMKIFYEDQQSDIIDRRCLLYYYLSNEFNVDNNINADGSTIGTKSMLNKDQNVLPVQTEIKRIISNRNILYDENPLRTFSDETSTEKLLHDLYANANIDSFNGQIDEMTDLLGIMAVMPSFKDGKLMLSYMAADSFRIVPDLNNPNKIKEFWLQDYDTTNAEYIFRIWSDETYKIVTKDLDVIQEIENPYGVIPVAFCRNESNEFYSAGQYSLIEDQLVLNKIRYLQMKDSTYHGLSLKIGKNLGKDALTEYAYDQFILLYDEKNAMNDVEADIAFLKPEPAYNELQDYADRIKFNMYRKSGIPASMISDSNETQSGISRLLERAELLEVRKKRIGSRVQYERDLLYVVVKMGNADNQFEINEDKLNFNIDYADVMVLQEPKDEYEFDTMLMNDDLFEPVQYVKKWAGFDTVKSVAKTKKYLEDNRTQKDDLGLSDVSTGVEQGIDEEPEEPTTDGGELPGGINEL